MSEQTDGTQDTEEKRFRTEERVGMDEQDMDSAISQEQDQKTRPDDASRYEDAVDESLSGDDR